MNNEADSARNTSPEAALKVTRFVWAAFTLTMSFLFCAALVLNDGSSMALTPEREAFLRVFPAAGAATLAISLAAFLLLRRAARSALGEPRPMRYFAAVVVSCALNESVVVLGLVLTLITKSAADIIPYFGLAFGSNLLLFPTNGGLTRFMRR